MLLLAACGAGRHPSITPAGRCALGPPIAEIPVDSPGPGERHRLYEWVDSPELWAPAPADPDVTGYRAAVAARLGDLAPRSLLERQRAVYARTPGDGDAANGAALLHGVGALGPASCLEMLLWREQAQRYPMLEHPTEMGAYVLRAPGRVRVYHSSADRNGQKLRHEVTERVQADLASGFTLVAHLHNHPFMLDRKVGDRLFTTATNVDDVGGALAPSTNDVQAYRNLHGSLGLQGAWITNGFDSFHMRAEELDRLTGPR